jgi:hypothetical protein
MEESFRDEMRLVTLRLQLQGISSLIENELESSFYGLQMEGMQFREKETEPQRTETQPNTP